MSLSPEQIALRRMRVGSSEVGALLAEDPHRTALDIFVEKVLGREPEATEDEADHRAVAAHTNTAIVRQGYRRLHFLKAKESK